LVLVCFHRETIRREVIPPPTYRCFARFNPPNGGLDMKFPQLGKVIIKLEAEKYIIPSAA
jgi:hypothetical protein